VEAQENKRSSGWCAAWSRNNSATVAAVATCPTYPAWSPLRGGWNERSLPRSID